MNRLKRTVMAKTLSLACTLAAAHLAQAAIHPGGLHTQADFDRMRSKVAANAAPWITTFNRLAADPHAQTTWNPAPVTTLCRTSNNTVCGNNYTRTQEDAQAVYDLAIRYRCTLNTAYANRAIVIMDAWSSRLTGINGDSNQSLGAGIVGYLFAIGGEALRGYSGWSAASQTAFKNMLVNVIYPKNKDFLVRHHGTCFNHYRTNWDTCNMASMIAIGVFADNTTIFNEAVAYYQNGVGTGRITQAAWFVHPDGLAQTEEAGRDQPHNMGGWDSLGLVCEIAWNQGVDLYGYADNRFWRGLEYIAKYNLGGSVSYRTYVNCENITESSISPRTGFSPQGWERAARHFIGRRGMAMPSTAQAAANLRPDGVPNNWSTHPARFDTFGIETLTFYDNVTPPTGLPPAGTYSLRCRSSGLMLDNEGVSSNGASVGQWADGTSNNQRWVLSYVSPGVAKLQCVTGGRFLDGMERTASGSLVGQWTDNTSTNQRWTLIDAGGGFFKLKNVTTGLCLDVGASPWPNGDDVQQYPEGTSQNQQWQFVAP